MEVETTNDYVLIDGYKFGKDELRYDMCASNAQRVTYREEHHEAGVTAPAIGTKCKDYGETALHVSY